MAMQFACPKCAQVLNADEKFYGKTVKCPKCKSPLKVPAFDGAAQAAADPLIGKQIAHYKIEALLGQGGMGKVYRAHNLRLDAKCAIKILPPDFAQQDQTNIQRFIREARSAAKVRHPNVLAVHNVGKVGSDYFIEMDYIAGGTLDDLLAEKGKLEPPEAAGIIRDVAKALDAAREQGIVHRDIKPSNVMLTEKGHVLVTDFGLAKAASMASSLTMSGAMLGTPLYMSPEQAMQEPADHRSDIYSLGCMFYQLLTGKPPYMADAMPAIIYHHVYSPVPDVREAAPAAPEILVAMISRMMDKKPDSRYQSCADLVRDLDAYLASTVAAVPAVSASLARKATEMRKGAPAAAARKSKAPLYAVAGAVLALIVVAVGFGLLKTKGGRKTTTDTTLTTQEDADSHRSTQTTEHRGGTPLPPAAAPKAQRPQPKAGSYDGFYVTTAATGEKIPHPLSRKTYTIEHDGKKIEVPEGMVFVPAGSFLMGEGTKPPFGPQHEVHLDAYFIGKYEVTNAEYMEFVKATGHPMPQHWLDDGGKIPEGRDNHPVVWVSWEDAKAYSDWCGKRLPTEAEWEKAAGWDMERRCQREFPWGDNYDPRKANHCYQLGCACGGEGGSTHSACLAKWWKSAEGGKTSAEGGNTAPVGQFTGDKSFFGCFDMGGNVREWTVDWYDREYYKKGPSKNPTGPTEDEAPLMTEGDDKGKACRAVAVRGGYWSYFAAAMRTTMRHYRAPKHPSMYVGFRCAADCPWRPPAAKAARLPVRKAVAPAPPQPAPSSYDGTYVATAGTGEEIPHPLSRKAYTIEHDGKKIEVPEGMVFVPAGPFLMGRGNDPPEGPQHEVYLDAYFIGKYEVTNAQYMEFVKATGHRTPQHWKDNGGKIPEGRENHPVVWVSWEDAKAYCDWCGKRLPTEAEWEKAAGWDMKKEKQRDYPWGDDYDPTRANHCYQLGCRCNGSGAIHRASQQKWSATDDFKKVLALGGNTAPVGSFGDGRSFFGCLDMSGNVNEWVNDWYQEDYYKVSPTRNPGGPREEEATLFDGEPSRVSRGGFWHFTRHEVRTWRRFPAAPGHRTHNFGFRCAADYPWMPPEVKPPVAPAPGAEEKQPEKEARPAAPAKGATSEYDGVYVTEAATGEKIPHPLSRKTYTIEYEGRKIEVPEGMVLIPAGPFLMGEGQERPKGPQRGGESPLRDVYLDAYFIDKYEVTNAQYWEFVKATKHPMPQHWQENGGQIPEGRENHPVTFVSWEDVRAYCDWCGKRLPTEAEWEKAAGWDMGKRTHREYPWGDDCDPRRANFCYHWGCRCNGETSIHLSQMDRWKNSEEGKRTMREGGCTASVGKFNGDVSFFECFDMGGNVREWVNDWFQKDYYKVGPKKNPPGPEEGKATLFGGKPYRVLRGGNFSDYLPYLRAAYRYRCAPSYRSSYVGFRCAADYPTRERRAGG